MMSGIYTITNTVNGHRYVGSAVNLRKREQQHWNRLRRGVHRNGYLQNARNKYGEKHLAFRVLLWCDKDDLILFEQRAFDVLRPEYNIALQASNPMLGRNHTNETKAKLSVALTGRILAVEHRAKLSVALTGRKLTYEHKAKLSAARTGNNNPMYGKKHTDETRAKIAAAKMGHTHTDETRAKMSATKKALWENEEYRAKMSVAQKAGRQTRRAANTAQTTCAVR